MKDFKVCISVTGRFVVTVSAETIEKAKEIAEHMFSEADFGELKDVDGDVCVIEDNENCYYYK